MKACIDIGGTKVAVSLNSGAGLDLVARRAEPTAKSGTSDALAQQVLRMVDEACAEADVAPHTVQRAGVSSLLLIGHSGPSRFCARLLMAVLIMIEAENAARTSFQSFSVNLVAMEEPTLRLNRLGAQSRMQGGGNRSSRCPASHRPPLGSPE